MQETIEFVKVFAYMSILGACNIILKRIAPRVAVAIICKIFRPRQTWCLLLAATLIHHHTAQGKFCFIKIYLMLKSKRF
jgi:hypothetical protein